MTGPFRLDRALISVSGPDAAPFLQNLLTQDITGAGDVAYAALLSPQGKVSADMLVWPAAEGFVLEADPAHGEALARKLSLYKLRADVAIEPAAQHAVLWAPEEFTGASRDPRLAALGWRKLAAAQSEAADGGEAYMRARIAAGAPDLARDAASDEVFALEALLEELNGVAFHKGCFVGQENVSRMKRRATTRKKFCPVTFAGAPPAYGAPITAGAAELGAIRTGVAGRAMALLRLDRALAALEDGKSLEAEGRTMTLAPPPWLILPPREGG